MTKPPLKGLAGAAMLLLLSAQIAAAGPDGTCEDLTAETVASEPAAPSTPAPTAAAEYTKIAQAAPAAGNNVTRNGIGGLSRTNAASAPSAGRPGR